MLPARGAVDITKFFVVVCRLINITASTHQPAAETEPSSRRVIFLSDNYTNVKMKLIFTNMSVSTVLNTLNAAMHVGHE